MNDKASSDSPDQMSGTDILITLSVSNLRRIFALAVLLLLAFLLLWIGFLRPPAELGWQAFLIILGLLVLWLAEKMRLATRRSLVLTKDAVLDGDGNTLMRLDEIDSVSRGFFAFKPSNGFVLVGTRRQPRLWAPGVYWRLGWRLGIGGITNAREAKTMAEAIAMMVAERKLRSEQNHS